MMEATAGLLQSPSAKTLAWTPVAGGQPGDAAQDAQNVHTMMLYPWLLLPSLRVVAAVLMFNFLGARLRDTAGPYK